MRTGFLTTISCWLWTIAVAGYMLWGWVDYAGLFKWLAELQTERFGKYYPAMTAIIPFLLLAGPALWLLGSRNRPAILREGPDNPFDLVLDARRNARVALMLVPLFAAIAIGSYWLSTRLPDDGGPPVRVDVTALGDAEPPLGHVMLIGTIDTTRATGVTEDSAARAQESFYVPLVAHLLGNQIDNGAPIRFFIERKSYRTTGDAAAQTPLVGNQSGILVKNGLPGELIDLYAKGGIRLAEPHYVLVSSTAEVATPYHVVAALCGAFALMLLVIAPALVVGARRAARRQGRVEV